MMKVALVAYALNVGGMETFMFGLARQLQAKGLEPTFVITDYIGPWHNKPLEEGFKIETILSSPWKSRIGHARALARFLCSFDVILLNHSVVAQSTLGMLPESTIAISILHNDHDDIYSIGLANLENADMIVAVSEKIRAEAIRRGAPPEKVRFIRNGVDVFDKYPKGDRPPPPLNEPLRIVYVGRIEHSQKGVFYLPGIMSKVALSGNPASLDLVGDGKDMLPLQNKFSKLPETKAYFHGALSHDEAMDILLASDVLLLPSHHEGQPVTLFEAMARGVVPVVSNLNKITNTVVANGKSGILVKVGDEEAFAEALITLAENRTILRNISITAWQVARDEYSIDRMGWNYMDLITEAIRKKRGHQSLERSHKINVQLLGRYSRTPLILQQLALSVKKIVS
jgi:glycosyltransferase involved in cell wall biosynthesis